MSMNDIASSGYAAPSADIQAFMEEMQRYQTQQEAKFLKRKGLTDAQEALRVTWSNLQNQADRRSEAREPVSTGTAADESRFVRKLRQEMGSTEQNLSAYILGQTPSREPQSDMRSHKVTVQRD